MKVLVALLLGAIVELYVMYLVARWLGFWSMLGLVVLVSIIGFTVIRLAGVRALRRFAAGEPPTKELADGAVILTAGILLAVPGFVSGVFGAVLLLPPVRSLVRGQLSKRASAAAARFTNRAGFQSTTIIATYDRNGVEETTATEVHGELPPNDGRTDRPDA